MSSAGGKGLAGIYPSLAESDWINGDPDRLIRIVLHGLSGPIEVNGKLFQSETEQSHAFIRWLERRTNCNSTDFSAGVFW